ncbi:MAG TPA: transporter, partial [Mycobacterium sp.]|nr:transporter [Mycobacterium sp.]
PAGLSASGLPVTVFQPELAISYESGPWLFTAYSYAEISTENTQTHYQSAPIFHEDLSLLYTAGKWSFGPVVDFFTQVGNDSSSSFYANTALNQNCIGAIGFQCVNTSTYYQWSAGGLVQYNFGPVTVQFWATDVFAAGASGASPVCNTALPAGGVCTTGTHDPGQTASYYELWFQASWALYTPEEPAAPVKRPLIYK